MITAYFYIASALVLLAIGGALGDFWCNFFMEVRP